MEIDCEAFYIYFKLQFFAQTQKNKTTTNWNSHTPVSLFFKKGRLLKIVESYKDAVISDLFWFLFFLWLCLLYYFS